MHLAYFVQYRGISSTEMAIMVKGFANQHKLYQLLPTNKKISLNVIYVCKITSRNFTTSYLIFSLASCDLRKIGDKDAVLASDQQ